MTTTNVPTLPVQHILAAFQRSELLLGDQAEFVLTGWYPLGEDVPVVVEN